MPELLVAADAACVRWALFKTIARQGEGATTDATAAATALAAKGATHCSAGAWLGGWDEALGGSLDAFPGGGGGVLRAAWGWWR
jgi:hypothetical protein